MNLQCILIALISCTAMESVHSQIPSIPMPPIPMPPIPMPPMPIPMVHDDVRVRRNAQVTPLEQRNRRNAQRESVPALAAPTAISPMKQRNPRSASISPMTADFQAINIVGNVEPELFGIRGKREARGGRRQTKHG